MSKLTFQAATYVIDEWLIVHLPKPVSKQLPSRGMVMGTGTVNNQPFTLPLEPDGQSGHWFNIDKVLRKSLNIKPGDILTVTLEPTTDWPRPQPPADLLVALQKAPKAHSIWTTITPKAQWEWLRWIRSTKQTNTRNRRIEVAISKMNSGMRRPCCFNSAMCTVPEVSKNGLLLNPS